MTKQNWLAIFVVLAVISTAIITDSDLNKFPFISDVWGNVSEWCMVIVTGFTLFYLVKTFRSQQAVQMLQLKVTSIENERYRLEHMPKFSVSTITKDLEINTNNVKQHLTIRTELLDSDVSYCQINVRSKNTTLVADTENILSANDVSKGSLHEINFYLKSTRAAYDAEGFRLNVRINFIDPVRNIYYQDFMIILTYSNVIIEADDTPTYSYKN